MFEAGLLVQRLAPRVDHAIPNRWVLRPGRHEAPAHRFDAVSLALANEHRNVFSWRNVEAGLEQRAVLGKIEPHAKIGEFTGKKIVTTANGSATYNAGVEERQAGLERSMRIPVLTFRFLAMALLLLTEACSFNNAEPPVLAPPQSVVPAPETSFYQIPITFPLASLQQQLFNALKPNVDQGGTIKVGAVLQVAKMVTRKVTEMVPTPVQKLVPETRTECITVPGGPGPVNPGGVPLPRPCINRQITVMVPKTVTELVATEVDKVVRIVESTPIKDLHLDYSIVLQSVEMSMKDNILSTTVVIRGKTQLKAGNVATIGSAQCGISGEMPEFRLTEKAKIDWQEDAQLHIEKTPVELTWSKPCNLTAAKVSLDDVFKIPALKKLLEKQLALTYETIPATIDLTTKAQSYWSTLNTPCRQSLQDEDIENIINPKTGANTKQYTDITLHINPIKFGVVPFKGTGDLATTAVSLEFNPILNIAPHGVDPLRSPPDKVVCTKPVTGVPKLPPLNLLSGKNHVSLRIEGAITLERANKELTTTLKNERFDLSPFGTAKIDNVNVYPTGPDVVMKVQISEPFRGTIYFIGSPVYNSADDILTFRNLHFTLETKNLLANVADWLLHSKFDQMLQEKAQIKLNQILKQLVAGGHIVRPLDDGTGKLRFDITQVQPVGVFVDLQMVHVFIDVDGFGEIELSP